MAQSISLSVEVPSFTQSVPPNLLPPFGHQRRLINQSNKSKKSPSTLPSRSKQNGRGTSTIRRQADVIRYAGSKKSEENIYDQIEMQQRLYFHNVFAPGVHSTPLYTNKLETHRTTNLMKNTSTHSLNNINNNVHGTQPLPNFYINDYELFKSSSHPGNLGAEHREDSVTIPTISNKVDNLERSNLSMDNSRFVKSKIMKKRGMCGVSWILRLGFQDSTVGKVYRKQIGWIVFVLIVFVLIGFALVPFSSHFSSFHLIKFTNFTQIPPKIESSESSTVGIVVLNHTTQEPMYSEDANIIIVQPVTEGQPTVVSIPDNQGNGQLSGKKSNLKTEHTMWKESINAKNDNLTNELMGFCRGCRKNLDICIATADSGIPVCRTAVDLNDPTGCGGLCALEIEACHLLNQKFSIYTCRPLEILQPCEQDEWRCANLLCIPQSMRCDGHINCYDRSDETNCACDLTSNFQCGNNTSCLNLSKKCDGNVDCWDGTDELNCTQACPDDQFTCNNGECIRRSLFCDGLADCADKSDEPSGCDGVCGKHEFACANKRCIAKAKVCNRTDNCGDMSDEINCPNVRNS